MLGSKVRGQSELPMAGSLRDLIPDDHVLARADGVLDLSWLRGEVRRAYAADGAVIGYHSNRRRPAAGAVRAITPLYRQLLEEERRHSTARAAVAASTRLLDELVAARADSYEELIWSVIAREER